MSKVRVLAVCGFGVGSSMILKMKIDEVLKANKVAANVFTTDVGSATSTPCDIIFTSSELGESIKCKVKVPVVVIHSFINKKEIEEKGLELVKQLANSL